MKLELRQTADGSSTFFVPELNEHYHSTNGALQESNHIFIGCGFNSLAHAELHILEVGFGTGLNAWLTALSAAAKNVRVAYTSLEKFPLNAGDVALLNYPSGAKTKEEAALFYALHESPWEVWQQLTPHFSLLKLRCELQDFASTEKFNLIYFDAFAPAVQPDLWTEKIFTTMFNALKPGGILVTYCAQGQVKRNMKGAGFSIERLPGPPGKREITRAVKGG